MNLCAWRCIRADWLLNEWFCATLTVLIQNDFLHRRGLLMKNPLDSIWGTIISGLVLTLVLYVFLKNFILAGV